VRCLSMSVIACPSPLFVDFVYVYATSVQDLYECLLVVPWIGRSSPDLIILRVYIVKCDCECCSTVHVRTR